ncbi:TIC chloroplastic [Micractinium conductrix]|uniref:TIC chloroplastic n=1 Tax=Micractinium conductrix TaxID=554055 RepID=A0A2P6VDH7_9CHLO|nr:TIC chloroplastic [Micractinium conductrix]|eukprot:PSC72129.1 TIC chloroplastic [Micractinium conductrix]
MVAQCSAARAAPAPALGSRASTHRAVPAVARSASAATLPKPCNALRQIAARRSSSASGAAVAGRSGALRVAAKAGGEVLVVGSSGQTAARVVVNLLRAGFKVTAGVDTDPDEAREVVNFAKKLDLLAGSEAANLKLAEFNPLDGDSIATVLKRGARVVLVVGDQAGNRRPDLRIYDAVVDALLENAGRIAQLVLVTPQGGGGTQIFGRGGGGSGRLSPLEAKVAESGVGYLIVRAAPSDRVTDRYGEQANVVVAPAGELPSGLQASRAQVAAVVAKAMVQSSGNAVVEVGASPAAPAGSVAAQVAAALAGGVLAAEEEEEEEEAPASKQGGTGLFGGFGTRKIAKPAAVEEEEEEEEEAPAPAPKKGGFFTIGGTRKVSKPAPVEEEEEAVPAPAPAKKGGFFTIGGTRKISKPEPAPVEEEEEEEEAPAPAKKPAFAFGGFGTRKISKPEPAAVEEEEEEEAPAPKKAFAFGTSGSRRPAAAVAVAEPEARPAAPQRVVRGRAPVAAPAEEKPARAAPARQAAAEPAAAAAAPKKSGGFLGFLGISNETVYADEPPGLPA